MEIHVYKYGMRLRPYDMYSKPSGGFVCVEKGGTADGVKYHNFVHYINRLYREVADRYDLDYPGATYLNAEER